jgi:hypothetical protein
MSSKYLPATDINRANNCYVTLFDTNLRIFGEVKYENISVGGHPML